MAASVSPENKIDIKVRFRKLNEKQTDELVGLVAELMVNFIKKQGSFDNGKNEVQHG